MSWRHRRRARSSCPGGQAGGQPAGAAPGGGHTSRRPAQGTVRRRVTPRSPGPGLGSTPAFVRNRVLTHRLHQPQGHARVPSPGHRARAGRGAPHRDPGQCGLAGAAPQACEGPAARRVECASLRPVVPEVPRGTRSQMPVRPVPLRQATAQAPRQRNAFHLDTRGERSTGRGEGRLSSTWRRRPPAPPGPRGEAQGRGERAEGSAWVLPRKRAFPLSEGETGLPWQRPCLPPPQPV